MTEKTTLTTAVYQKLRSDIIQGVFRPGEKLRIESIAASYEVGSNAVREALSRLSSERLVDRHEQRGFAAPSVGIEDWRTLVRTRCWLETRALQESMQNRTDAWEENIVVSFHRLSKCRSDSPEHRPMWEDGHRNFHRALIANCGSPWLIEFCDILADHAARYVFISNSYQKSPRDGKSEHEILMRAVLDGPIKDACEMLVRHYCKTLNLIEEIFGGERSQITVQGLEIDAGIFPAFFAKG
ncbi:GntR family transcriptional regulator [Limoniibacter endophyticus]|uniref:GntR family transcriptional regulator n=1 Tax=Limoniibacter endophyticus TaxID=1565040 RepID=A0A8J3DJI6_9HYPH|nr:GntR family transcriptional regulator [Limoniibacter endophyticus]GHC78271.1 GntR family transcriptional regulator [Limoniibacter endophyticus]